MTWSNSTRQCGRSPRKPSWRWQPTEELSSIRASLSTSTSQNPTTANSPACTSTGGSRYRAAAGGEACSGQTANGGWEGLQRKVGLTGSEKGHRSFPSENPVLLVEYLSWAVKPWMLVASLPLILTAGRPSEAAAVVWAKRGLASVVQSVAALLAWPAADCSS